jgi:hypothetical protein
MNNGLDLGAMSAGTVVVFVILIVWSIIWKGLALWRAARRYDTAWFIVFMFLNTVGILEIIYYFLIAKSDKK